MRDRLTAAFAALFLAAPGAARADIELSPLRQVLTETTRKATFSVSNPSPRILDARVTWIDMTATEAGYGPAGPDDRASLSAAPYLMVTPAQFRLEPGARQTIVVRLKDDVAPPSGERRSHLLIETAAARTSIRKAGGQGLEVDIGVGVSAPVLLRGAGRAAAEIGETRLLRDSEGLLLISTSVVPEGTISSYGRVAAHFRPEGSTEPARLLGVRENVAGFVDAERRVVEIPLGFFTLGAGELTLRYEGAEEFEGRLFDQRKFDIAPPR